MVVLVMMIQNQVTMRVLLSSQLLHVNPAICVTVSLLCVTVSDAVSPGMRYSTLIRLANFVMWLCHMLLSCRMVNYIHIDQIRVYCTLK